MSVTYAQMDGLLTTLQTRFEQHEHRHEGISWSQVRARLDANPQSLCSLHEMESSGGEPDVIGQDPKTGQFIFCDCSAESPAGRRSLCYDRAALESRKENRPAGAATEMAVKMGIALLTETEYRALQTLGCFDAKTSSWIQTPEEIRALGGALFCDRRYDCVFLYHNGAQSYYAARGFRGSLRV
ncbi:DUF4256 domain-containing protein [Aeromonas taiwanensis]|uniref:DUF4256 domain-containing protein n=1 Tax=Aeromonas taiwanensis TaxID=633417 RepID=UPI003B9E18F0